MNKTYHKSPGLAARAFIFSAARAPDATRLLNYLSNVLERYKLSKEEVEEILNQDSEENIRIYEVMCLIGKKRGCIVSGGNVDDEKTANIILDDFRNCKLGHITLEKV